MINKEEIIKIIEKNDFELLKNELSEILNYLSNSDFDKNILTNLVNRKINFEKKKNENKLKDLNINSLISFYSLARLESFEVTPMEKSLRIFPNIKNIFLIVTKESKIFAEKYAKTFLNGQIKIYDIETGNYEEVYNLLRQIIGENNIKKENLVIDNTLGNKMTSAVFYRFGVEQDTKIITWQNEQIIVPSGMAKRVPGTDNFNFIKEPEFFNFNTYKNIDNLLKHYKFEEAQMLFEQLNNRDMTIVCKAFSRIFNFETLSNIFGIYDEIESFLALTEYIEDSSLKHKVKKYRFIFSLLLNEIERKEVSTNNLYEINWNNFNEYQEKKLKSFYLNEVDKNQFIILLIIDFFINSYPFDLAYICIESTLKEEISSINWDKFRMKLMELSNKDIFLEDIGEFLEIEEYIIEFFLEREIIIFKPNLDFCKNLTNKISLNQGILTIPSLGINELLLKKLESDNKSKNAQIIYNLFDTDNYYLPSLKIIEIFKDSGKEISENQRISKYYGDLKKSIKEFNSIIKEEAKKKGKNIDDFFLLENEFNKSFKSLRINKNI